MTALYYEIIPAGAGVSIHTANPVAAIKFPRAAEAEAWIKDMGMDGVRIIAVERRELNYLEYEELNNAVRHK